MLKNQEFVVRDNYTFLVEKLDKIVKLESRYVKISTKWRNLKSDFLSKMNDQMWLNQNANIALPTDMKLPSGDEIWNVWYREPNQKKLVSTNLLSDNAKTWLGRNTIFYEKESSLTKLREKELKFERRVDVLQSALCVAIERFINKSTNYDSLKTEYLRANKAPDALMALNNKLIVLDFSGREYWYKYYKEYRTRGADQIPCLYKVCWSDNPPTRFTFGENK